MPSEQLAGGRFAPPQETGERIDCGSWPENSQMKLWAWAGVTQAIPSETTSAVQFEDRRSRMSGS
jgi:hypothetical protein